MKKIVLGLLIILMAIFVSVYFFIPGLLKVSSVIVVNCTINGTNRYLLDNAKWSSWWPVKEIKSSALRGKTVFKYKGGSYQLTRPLHNGFELLIEYDGLSINSFINNFPLSKDSVAIQWQYTLKTSANPITRWRQYQQARAMKTQMENLLVYLQSFLEKRANVYGIDIQEIFSRDTTLVVTTEVSGAYPQVFKIYGLIEKLKKHISTEKAIPTNYPMLHVRKLNTGQFETMVAIPVNKILKENNLILNKRFVPWKTLVAETKGGVYTIEQAYKIMDIFIEDYQRTPMAIPFELLITDRNIEPDTLKWVSVICQPVS